ncbi:MAG: CinA-like protein [Verrucomicrobiales bacterium]|nr:CinA-like protein [Verrucomicrobiales bacterium]
MLGRVLNTHQQWLCRAISDEGYEVARQTAIADEGTAIINVVKEAIQRSELIITTGGLGPTSDDITRTLLAELFGLPLHQDAAALRNIVDFFATRKKQVPAGNDIQAEVPEGATVFYNRHGTAPGLAIPGNAKIGGKLQWLIMLPGPPRELHPMFREQALPFIQKQFPLTLPFYCETYRTTGIGESQAQELIAQPLSEWVAKGVEVGYCAHVGAVDVRIAVRNEQGKGLLQGAGKILEELLAPWLYGKEDELLENVIVRLLTNRKKTLALAESCTGGYISHRITNVPGSSDIYLGGVNCYSNEFKINMLHVSPETLAKHGAVSGEVAEEMVKGLLQATGAEFGLSVTGIAGPGGGTESKPIGTVYIALGTLQKVFVMHYVNRYERVTFKSVTSQQALEMLRRELIAG